MADWLGALSVGAAWMVDWFAVGMEVATNRSAGASTTESLVVSTAVLSMMVSLMAAKMAVSTDSTTAAPKDQRKVVVMGMILVCLLETILEEPSVVSKVVRLVGEKVDRWDNLKADGSSRRMELNVVNAMATLVAVASARRSGMQKEWQMIGVGTEHSVVNLGYQLDWTFGSKGTSRVSMRDGVDMWAVQKAPKRAVLVVTH